MRNKKIILLILVTLLFSGCSVKYNLYINSDLSVNEEVTASDNTSTLKKNTGQEPKIAANSLVDLYKIKGQKYNITTTSNSDKTSTTAFTKFKSLEEYEDYFKSDIVKEVNLTQSGSYITLEYNQDVPLTSYSSKSLVYDSIEVNIDIPFKVTKHNADYVTGNTYTWIIKKDEDLKKIKVTFNKDETDLSKTIDLGFFKINVKYPVLLVFGIVIVILTIVLVVYIKNKKNNKF